MLNSKTHASIPMDKLMRWAGEVEGVAEGGKVKAEALDDLSADLGVPLEKLYAALAMSGLQIELEHELQFVVCTGGCQEFGSLDSVAELLKIKEQRLEDEQSGFDVVPKQCLNRCQVAPVVELRSRKGNAVLAKATPDMMSEAVDEFFSM